MPDIDEKRMLKRTLSYLGDAKQAGAEILQEEIGRCLAELQEEARFLACYEIYPLDFDKEGYPGIAELALSLRSDDLRRIVEGCTKICVLASTLGVAYERFGKRVMSVDMSHGVVLDAAASAYLECMTDIFEEELELGPHTFRYAPGYGDLSVTYNEVLLKAIRADKRIGITHTGGGLLLPQKSMLTLIGLGKEGKAGEVPCTYCNRKDDCSARQNGAVCRIS